MGINGQKWDVEIIEDEALLKETRWRYIKAMTISIIAIVVNVIALAFWAAVFVKYGLLGWQAGLLFVVMDVIMIVIAVKEIFYVKGLFEELRPSWNMYMFRQMYEKEMKKRKK